MKGKISSLPSPLSPRHHPMEYDLIIVGGGPSSAGLLRGILTRIKDRPNKPRIAVVERGGNNNNELSSPHHPASNKSHLHHWFGAAHYSSNNTSTNLSTTALHATTPQNNLHHRILDVPTGRGWGGTTNIHAGLFVSPPAEDFDAWPDTWKKRLPASVDAIMDVFQRHNAVEVSKSTIPTHVTIRHVAFRPVTTSSIESKRVSYYSVLVSSLLDEYPELRECITFLSGVEVERILIGDESKSGRWDNRARGVQCRRVVLSSNPLKSRPEQEQQHLFVLRAKSSIVLCAGAIGSPSLLMASGVGEESDLIAASIQPWYDKDTSNNRCSKSVVYRNLAVGRGLRDHILVPRIFLTSRHEDGVSSINSIRGWWTVQESMDDSIDGSKDVATYQIQLADGVAIEKMIPHFAAGSIRRKWSFFGRSFSPTLVSGAFYRLRAILHCILRYIPGLRNWISIHFASVNVCLMNPKSVGKVGLRRQNIPASSVTSINSPSRLSEFQVVIDPGYLSDTRDVHALWRGWKMTAIVKSQCGDWIEILPGYCFVVLFKMCECFVWMVRWLGMLVFGTNDNHVDNCGSNDNTVPQWFRGYVSEFAVPYYHWFGTCAMGPVNAHHRHDKNNNSDFVVDELLRVRGISGLRMCDASVFPDCVTVPTALTCAALGYASAEFVQCDLNETNVY